MSDDGENGSESQDEKKAEPPEAPTNRQTFEDDSPTIELDSDSEDG